MSPQDQGPEQPGPYGYGPQYGVGPQAAQPPYGQPQYGQQPYGPPQPGAQQYGQPYGPGTAPYPGVPYPGAGYGPPGYPPAAAPTSGLAVASLVCGIVGLLLGPAGLLTEVPALFMGMTALRRIPQRGEQGRGLALAGVILSVAGMILAVVWIIFIVYLIHKVNDLNNSASQFGAQ
jgi:hypothetical protein